MAQVILETITVSGNATTEILGRGHLARMSITAISGASPSVDLQLKYVETWVTFATRTTVGNETIEVPAGQAIRALTSGTLTSVTIGLAA